MHGADCYQETSRLCAAIKDSNVVTIERELKIQGVEGVKALQSDDVSLRLYPLKLISGLNLTLAPLILTLWAAGPTRIS